MDIPLLLYHILEGLILISYIVIYYYKNDMSENTLDTLHYYLNILISIGLIIIFNPVVAFESLTKMSIRPLHQIFNRTFTESIGFSAGIIILTSAGLKRLIHHDISNN